MRMIECGDDVAVARKLRIGGIIALIVAERAVGEYDKREASLIRVGIEEMRRNLGKGAVVFKAVGSAFVDEDSVRLSDSVPARCRETVVIGKDERGRKRRRDQAHRNDAADDCPRLLSDAVVPSAHDQPNDTRDQQADSQNKQNAEESPFHVNRGNQNDAEHQYRFCRSDDRTVFPPCGFFAEFGERQYDKRDLRQCEYNQKYQSHNQQPFVFDGLSIAEQNRLCNRFTGKMQKSEVRCKKHTLSAATRFIYRCTDCNTHFTYRKRLAYAVLHGLHG